MTNQNDSQSEAFNVKEFISEALSYKYLYIASFFVCLLIAFLVNKFSPTVFQVNSVIGPVEDKRSSLLGSNDLFSGLELRFFHFCEIEADGKRLVFRVYRLESDGTFNVAETFETGVES